MGVYNSIDDFSAFMMSLPNPMREIALDDAWSRFKLPKYDDTSMRDFKKVMLTECPHYFHAPAADTPDDEALYNVDAQVRYVKAHSQEQLISLLAANGLTPGRTLQRPVADHATGENNPWSDTCKLSAAEKERRISSLIRSNATLAASLARSAGKTLTGQKIATSGQPFRDPGAQRR